MRHLESYYTRQIVTQKVIERNRQKDSKIVSKRGFERDRQLVTERVIVTERQTDGQTDSQ